MFERICIANRGEIAVRIARTCHRLGIGVHAVFSDADASALHVRVADSATRIGPSTAAVSYLNGAAIIEAARHAGCDAIHPGYGLLSENAEFARACRDAGLTFVGPDVDHIRLMGDKHRAREEMSRLGVPVAAGSPALVDAGNVERLAEAVGYPLMIKASHGGGGLGLAGVDSPAELTRWFTRALSTVRRAFGSEALYLEKYIAGANHVEFQVVGDGAGNVVVIGDRQCSVQRRHQKVLEEGPSPALRPETRRSVGAAIEDALGAIRYRNAGTVEGLLDPSGEFFFLEMNTRLQVEHRVTEALTGLDLVEWQIRVAAGETVEPLRSIDASDRHAIEARICAEDPVSFAPSPGRIERFEVPEAEDVQLDAGYEAGDEVTPYYDSLIAKLIVSGADRFVAVGRMQEALAGVRLSGIKHNVPFLERVLAAPSFADGSYDLSIASSVVAGEGVA